MGLLDQARADLATILADEAGFSICVKLTNPVGEEWTIRGLVADVSQLIDPQTGQAVSGRAVSIALPLNELANINGLGTPAGESELTKKPWTLRVTDSVGNEGVFKVRETRPDRMLDVIVCLLEAYKPL